MDPSLSQFGREMAQLTGVRAIMKDIIETLRSGGGRDWIDLSAGNPVILPELEQLWRDCTAELTASSAYGEAVCRYGASQGYEPLIEAIVEDFNRRYGCNLSDRNVLIAPGSQALYFYAANAFGGYDADGRLKPVLLPLSPDYTGYEGVSLYKEALQAQAPGLEVDEAAHRFKYRPDLDGLPLDEQTGCLMLSRPCNPSGNVLSADELAQLADRAAAYNVPVVVDAAYASPYPGLDYEPAPPLLRDNIIHCLSLSKAGLPGERVGIAIGHPDLIQILESFQTNLCIHSSRYGQAIAARAIASGRLGEVCERVIRPHYRRKFELLAQTLDATMPDSIPWFLHRGEGAIFGWLWFRDLPVSDWDLYQELKAADVIAVPGSSFFPGLRQAWSHKQQCVRVSLTASEAEIERGTQRLAETLQRVYRPSVARSTQ